MQTSNRMHRRIVAVLATGCVGLALAGAAYAVDLRDWGQQLPASERFVVIFGNKAVLDKETQLVWQRTPSATAAATWEYAKAHCIDGVFAGRRGWRLPSMHELSSLADPSKPYPELALPTGHPFSAGAKAYWSATRDIAGSGQPTGDAYVVFFQTSGNTVTRPTTINYAHAWCVRGGGTFTGL